MPSSLTEFAMARRCICDTREVLRRLSTKGRVYHQHTRVISQYTQGVATLDLQMENKNHKFFIILTEAPALKVRGSHSFYFCLLYLPNFCGTYLLYSSALSLSLSLKFEKKHLFPSKSYRSNITREKRRKKKTLD